LTDSYTDTLAKTEILLPFHQSTPFNAIHKLDKMSKVSILGKVSELLTNKKKFPRKK
jgi:hypothetical protein